MANENDILIGIGLDDSNLVKDLKAVKATLQQWRNNLANDTNLQAKFGIAKGDVNAVEQTLKQIDAAYAKTSAKLKDPTILAQGSVAAAKEAQKNAEVQGKIYNDYLEWQHKADVKAAADREKLRANEDKIYNDYLSSQTAGLKKQAAEKEKLRANEDRLYNDYLAKQEAGIKKQAEAERQAMLARENSLPRLRYALYDVAAGAQRVSDFFTQIGVASVNAAMEYETAFTRVEQTTGGTTNQLAALKNDLLSLAKEIPVAFTDISAIASIGAQMGIATESLGEFTKTVSQFASITNVTIENAALSFGALGELLNVSADDFKNLGSAIAYAGVKSNATESEILAVSTAIAGVASTANLTPQYVLGLSTALASLRVPAEQSRGAITRVFQEINRAASTGENLNAFAEAMGVSEEAAKKLASTDMGQFFNQFVSGLSKMDAQGITKTLDALSLSDIRVTNTLSRLAKNTDIVAQSFQNVDTAYQSGTFLQETAAKRIDDFAAKLQILTNTFNEIAAQVGGIFVTAFGGLVDILTSVSKWLSDISKNPVGIFIISVGAAIGGLIAAVTSLVAILSVAAGGFLAARTALTGLVTSTGAAEVGIVRFAARLVGLDAVALASAANIQKLSSSIAGVGVASNALGKAGPWMLAITIGLTAVAAGWDLVANATKSAADKSKEYYGSNASIIEAAKQDTAELAAGVQTVKDIWNSAEIVPIDLTPAEKSAIAMKEAAKEAANAVGPIDSVASSESGLEKSASGATSALNAQTIAFGKNAKAAALKIIQDKIMSDSENPLLKIFTDPKLKSAMQESGVSVGNFVNDLLSGDSGAARAQQSIDAVKQKAKELRDQMVAGDDTGTNPYFATQARVYEDLAAKLEQTREKTVGLIPEQVALADALNGVTNAAGGASKVSTIFDGIEAKAKASKDFVDNLDTLSTSIKDNGTSFDSMTAGGIANIGALNSAINSAISAAQAMGIGAAGTIGQVFAQLQAQGIETAQLLQQLQAQGGVQAQAAMGIQEAQAGTYAGLTSVYNQMKSAASGAGRAADTAAKKVRTLTDYANDLATVFKRAFDIRFSAATDLDKITKGFKNIAQSISDARDEINSLNADIAELTADKALQEYFLTVANAYGDSLSAQQIQAKLVKINSDLAAKNKTLAKAQDKTNKTLVGNSDAAIENRAEILGLVSDYQSYIQSLAASGASQDTLRAAVQQAQSDFMAQATQLGYNSNELQTYASAFNDVTVAINNVPRDITVDANADPAIQAMNELKAKADAATASRTMNIGMSVDYGAMAKFARGAAIVADISRINADIAEYNRKVGNGTWDQDPTYLNALLWFLNNNKNKLNSGDFSSGGYTGAGGKYEVAGIVHRGEYVVPKEQVNQSTGLPYYMQQPRTFAQGGYASSTASTMMVSLSPEDRAILRSAGGSGEVVLYANNVELARSVNDGNRTIVAQGGRP